MKVKLINDRGKRDVELDYLITSGGLMYTPSYFSKEDELDAKIQGYADYICNLTEILHKKGILNIKEIESLIKLPEGYEIEKQDPFGFY